MINKILIAIDDGPPAAAAVDAGLDLARQLQARVALLHVVDISLALRPEIGLADQALLVEMNQRGQRLLDQTIAKIEPNLKPQRMMIEGDPAETIIAAAKEWAADLIVIGSDARGRLAHFLLGSTADGVIRRAPCPVLTVRQTVARSCRDAARVAQRA